MIFICLGTQIYQFDRLLREVDVLIEKGEITQEVFAQAGSINYVPKNFSYSKFLSHDEFEEYINKADLIISHGGTGALIGASKLGKNIIAVPRLAKYHEHTDDHQLQIVSLLERQGYIRAVYDIKFLASAIKEALAFPIEKKYSRESNVIDLIERFIEGTN